MYLDNNRNSNIQKRSQFTLLHSDLHKFDNLVYSRKPSIKSNQNEPHQEPNSNKPAKVKSQSLILSQPHHN